jgi:hypothetical protein
MAIKPGGHGDVTKTHVRWRHERALPEVPSPLYYRRRVYMVRDGGLISCLDAKTGQLLYRERVGAAGVYFSSPVAGDGHLSLGPPPRPVPPRFHEIRGRKLPFVTKGWMMRVSKFAAANVRCTTR